MAFLDRAIGIDLGTTNSEVAWLPPSEREVVIFADRFGRKTIPSAVAWDDKAGAFLVGHAARSKRGTSTPPIESIKRRMGQPRKTPVGPHELLPEEVSAKILAELRARICETLAQQKVAGGSAPLELRATRAVITVPAYFDGPQVEATRRAGELAGLDVIGILQEPTAAAIYHTWKRRLSDGNFLVYDLGGGTFDVSILRCVGGEYQVLAIDGDNFLGGDDLDRRYAEHLRKELVAKGYALDLDVANAVEDQRLFGRLVHLAQEIKESLSTTEVAHVSKSEFMKDKSGELVSFEGDVGRADYERIVADLVETTIACAERALARSLEVANVGKADIDHVILVGGSTRVPLVVRRVSEAFCAPRPGDEAAREPLRDDVDTCVALGAAIHASHVGGTILGRDAEGTAEAVRLRVTTPFVSQSAKLRFGLEVIAAPKAATHVAIWEGERSLAEGALSKDALRFDLPLGEAPETAATVALQTSVGAPVAELPLPLHRGDLRPRPTALSRASVVAKDVSLEVVRGGRRDRKILIARGTGLPASVSHLFFTADQTGAIVLRIMQNRLPIKTLVIDVPRELPVGSPVEVVLRCDESMRLEAQATVGATQIQAHIEPREAENDGEGVEALLERVEKARRSLWGDLSAHFGREADRLVIGIREAIQTDPDKTAALSARLRHLLDEYHGGEQEELVPPMARMEEAFDLLRRVVYRASGAVMSTSREDWERRIDALYDKAMEAHGRSDGPVWRRVFNEVQALCETAYQEEFSQMSVDDPAYLQRRILVLGVRARRLEEALAELVPSAADEIRGLQLAEKTRIDGWLAGAVSKPLAALRDAGESKSTSETRRTLEILDAEIERIEAAVERLPSLGLVTDRGGKR